MRGEAAISSHMAGKVLKEFARLAEIETGHIVRQLTPREGNVVEDSSFWDRL
jgi:hypothetical protein